MSSSEPKLFSTYSGLMSVSLAINHGYLVLPACFTNETVKTSFLGGRCSACQKHTANTRMPAGTFTPVVHCFLESTWLLLLPIDCNKDRARPVPPILIACLPVRDSCRITCKSPSLLGLSYTTSTAEVALDIQSFSLHGHGLSTGTPPFFKRNVSAYMGFAIAEARTHDA